VKIKTVFGETDCGSVHWILNSSDGADTAVEVMKRSVRSA